MSKNILVSKWFACDVLALVYCLKYEPVSDKVLQLCASIEADIKSKIQKMNLHDAFSAYKSAQPGPQRELLRQEYIRLAGLCSSFVSELEKPYDTC